MADEFPFPDPRQHGINEHHHRARWFISLASQAKDYGVRFRLLITAIYFARGITELMLYAAEKQMLKDFRNKNEQKSRKQYEEQLSPTLPHYHLIEKIRIHDFHRFGCVPPDPKYKQVFFGGPMKLRPSKRSAVLSIPASGPKITTTGNSSAKDQRTLCSADGHFFDDVSKQHLPLEKILTEYLEAVPVAIERFERSMAG